MSELATLHAILQDLETRLDPDTEQDYRAQWVAFWENKTTGSTFTPCRKRLLPPEAALPDININDAIQSPLLMLIKELANASALLNTRECIPSVRMNYGTGILSSLLGAEIFTMPYATNTLPTTRVITEAQLEDILDKGIPDLYNGFGRNVWETAERYLELVQGYPKVMQYLDVYHPDLQGPLDIAELMMGGDLCYLMYDAPEKVHAFLQLITQTYARFMEKWQTLFPPKGTYSTHWCNMVLKGQLALRCDSGMNLSPAFYREFSLPYDRQLLQHFGGGILHFCGRGDHYISIATELPELYGINLSQPEYNDMEKIFSVTVDKNVKILSYSKAKLEEGYCRKNGVYHGCLHVL